ncbi:MAG TPA: adenylosuccinate lyase, partial [Chloroflexota bacterium]|nr:adenylosuccinate lyase [Chloroflexota bacterium]
AAFLSEGALIRYRVRVEIEWLRLLSERPEIDRVRSLTKSEASILHTLAADFDDRDAERVKAIEKVTRHDVKAVEYYLRERLEPTTLADMREFIHFCCTSEDINNLAYSMMLKDAIEQSWRPRADALVEQVVSLAQQTRDVALLARTHGQAATPTTLGKELAVFAYRWQRQLGQLGRAEYLGKFNGAVGNFNAHVVAYPNAPWEQIAQELVNRLGLTYNPLTTQIEPHDFFAEIFHILIRFNTITLDFVRDMWTYISLGYFQQRAVGHEVGSSVMPHKVNPIDFENAEANLGLSTAVFEHLTTKLPVSRLQRDLSDSSALRNVGVALGHSVVALHSARSGLGKVAVNRELIAQDLTDAWEVLAEAIQTVMRNAGYDNPYDRLKQLTRGTTIAAAEIHSFIEGLDLPASDKERLRALSPADYVGLASALVRHVEG